MMDKPPERSSELLLGFYRFLKKISPFAWLFALLAGLGAFLFRGLETLFDGLAVQAKTVGSEARVHPGQGDTLVGIAKFVRESAPFSAGLAILFSLVAILCEGLKVIFQGWQARVDGGKGAPEPTTTEE